MPSLLLVVFILQLVLHLINTVGASSVDELLWVLYNKLPTPTSKNAQRCQALKKEIVQLKRELGNTSAQDNFGKWAKLDRQHNKAMTEYQKLDGSLRTHQTAFNSAVKAVRFLGTQGLRFVLQFWFSKSPMFWLPAGWVPYYVEWILSFPRAPLGSISIQVWTAACAAIIALASEGLAAVWVLATKKPVPTAKKEPMAFEAGADEKKEL
ncbi:CHD5-like protein-domain-containing protein [Boeremia exigua]|uniref:CHD5-like protein-domain-containing protein n=1 Tax=Boeremia exigua TaxID=749465 RepID=UPI001E8DEF3D|nr:CHD5-like protein-domain-containing protein [Boeremia exigua]KAH6639756.1 CHD5-like protein-domain-containing protein [Boeremia exigua]